MLSLQIHFSLVQVLGRQLMIYLLQNIKFSVLGCLLCKLTTSFACYSTLELVATH